MRDALADVLARFSDLTLIRQFQILWSSLIALSLALDFPSHLRFYHWFHNSGLEMAKLSGYGQSAGRFYGVVPAPKLSVPAMALCGIGLIASLILSCTDLINPQISLASALVFYHCYISQLYAEVHVVAHNMALVPPVLIICIVCPDIAAASAEVAAVAQQWPLFVLKFLITTAYCSAACCKLTKVVTDGADWSSGATMQAVMFEAIMGLNLPSGKDAHFTFYQPTPYSRRLQRWLFQRPRFMGLMSLYGVLIELVAPLVLVFPLLDVPFAACGLMLHYGIAYCQNIDFLAWWGPFYVVFFLGRTDAGFHYVDAVIFYARQYPVGCSLAVAYMIVHLAGMVIHRLIPHIDMLPLSRFPMFDSPKNLWDPQQPHWAWLTEKKQASGELMNFAFPMCRPQHVQPSEIDTLPFKYLLFGKPSPADEQLTVYTNVVVTEEMQMIIERFSEEWQKGAEKYTDPTRTAGMLELVDAAKLEFEKASRRMAQVEPRPAASDLEGGRGWIAGPGRSSTSSIKQPLLEGTQAAHDVSGALFGA